MKKIQAIVSSIKVRGVAAALVEARFSALTIAAAVGFRPDARSGRDLPVPMDVLEVVVGDWQVEAVLEIILASGDAQEASSRCLGRLTATTTRFATAPNAAAKSGIELLTQHVAAEVGPFAIRVDRVAPSQFSPSAINSSC